MKNLIRLYCNAPIHNGAIIPLTLNQTHYLKNVMRKKVSDVIAIFNGKDGQWQAEIMRMDKKSTEIVVTKQTRTQYFEPDIQLCFAPIKKMDFLVQKATELGVSSFQPVITKRTVVHKIREEKFIANAIEASEQCERLSVPEILPVVKLDDLLAGFSPDRRILLCDETGEGKSAKEVLLHYSPPLEGGARGGVQKTNAPHPTSTSRSRELSAPWAILIGPEGGFSADELAILRKLPYVLSIGLGPRILRAETAALAALTCWQEHLGDWDNMPSSSKTFEK